MPLNAERHVGPAKRPTECPTFFFLSLPLFFLARSVRVSRFGRWPVRHRGQCEVKRVGSVNSILGGNFLAPLPFGYEGCMYRIHWGVCCLVHI